MTTTPTRDQALEALVAAHVTATAAQAYAAQAVAERDAAVAAAVAAGHTGTSIAATLGVKQQQVSLWLRRHVKAASTQ